MSVVMEIPETTEKLLLKEKFNDMCTNEVQGFVIMFCSFLRNYC